MRRRQCITLNCSDLIYSTLVGFRGPPTPTPPLPSPPPPLNILPGNFIIHSYPLKVSKDLKHAVICDMGVTRLKKATEATITSTGRGPGTYLYMAPEMFRKSRRGKPVDIYSLGCTLLELFGQRRVWLGLDASEIMMRVCVALLKPLPQCQT